ncbi:MAG: hypothetical protein ACXVFR_17650 [Nocardioidaceae bacterium]
MTHLSHRALLGLLLGLALLGLPVLTAGAATAVDTWSTRATITSAPTRAVYARTVKIAS